ncbi:uncharacterized protein BDR25DRAFT_315181 [Lindgomyces ingoldianus]|uniref:Uncharacterized protein n=1 Tax=Lindgomyces ingoldianus TaxID=673940 RepID=A0ACB6QRR4_9PLEO|nr:uncharacterized protein BDR25DRAFT_315181 [Lindgomyces ingoldianus]KAF2469575.1 hypothetical protein BDR25DRAFT_315181 [Lindgomyces ingoldianus]
MSYPNLLDRGNVNGNAYGHTYRELYIGGGAKAHLGDNKFHFGPFNAPTTFSFPSGKSKEVLRVQEGAHDSPAKDRPETPPRPSAAIPFSRDKDFVKRSIILNQIHEQCAMPGSRTALVGLGGVGKSQLAIEFAYRTRERSSETWVFWVHAGNASRFEQGYREIADRVKISGRQNPEANIFKLVYDWLCDSKGQWLLILDNVDDACFLLDAPVYDQRQPTDSATASKPLREYLPHCQSGSILITTRNKDAALKLVEGCDIISVGPMDEEDALALFEKKLGVHHVSSGIAELAAALEHLPLAIVQAAAYISKRAPRCSVVDYLAKFKESDYKRTSLLNRNEGHLRRDWEAKNSIIITWKISFDYIHKTRPSAANLLSLMSFFDGQGIPENLLRNRTEHGKAQGNHKGQEDNELISHEEDTLSQSSAGDDEFEDNVLALRNFSFISVNVDGKTFRMHALVQVAMRKWLEEYGELDRWKQQFVKNLYAEFPTGEYENWASIRGGKGA